MKIGVFDSGIGGLSVAEAIRQALPENEIIFKEDSGHIPYGTRTPAEILGFVVPLLQGLVDEDCQIIVIACNTVSTTLIEKLRQKFSIPLIAMEPMIKPAAKLTKTKIIAVFATPATLASNRYKFLKSEYAKGLTVLEPDCSTWALMIEHNQVEGQLIKERIDEVLRLKADVIVLGCTHYHWIENEIAAIAAGRAVIIQPEQPVIDQLKRVIARLS